MILNSFKRIFATDYKEDQREIVTKLSVAINDGMDTLFSLGNKRISLRDNISCSVRDVSIIVDANGTPLTTTSASLDGTGKVDGVTVIYAANTDNSAILPTGQPWVTFSPQAKSIILTNVKGLVAGSTWTIRLVIWQL